MDTDRNGLEVLGREECLRLLRRQALGRIGLTSGALPLVLPVNYALAGDGIVLRTGRGTKLRAATERTVVAFEVDEVDPGGWLGWSVVVTGVAEEVTDPAEVARYRCLPLGPWSPGKEERFVRISTDIVTGRRAPASWRGSKVRLGHPGPAAAVSSPLDGTISPSPG